MPSQEFEIAGDTAADDTETFAAFRKGDKSCSLRRSGNPRLDIGEHVAQGIPDGRTRV